MYHIVRYKLVVDWAPGVHPKLDLIRSPRKLWHRWYSYKEHEALQSTHIPSLTTIIDHQYLCMLILAALDWYVGPCASDCKLKVDLISLLWSFGIGAVRAVCMSHLVSFYVLFFSFTTIPNNHDWSLSPVDADVNSTLDTILWPNVLLPASPTSWNDPATYKVVPLLL